jgi:hypothetical protein
VSVEHEIKPLDFPKRVDYCQWFLKHLNYNDILDKTFLGDESWFHLKVRTEMQQNIVAQHRRVTIFLLRVEDTVFSGLKRNITSPRNIMPFHQSCSRSTQRWTLPQHLI